MGIEVAIAATIASTALTAVGQISQAQQQAQTAETNAKLQRIEAARRQQAAREQISVGQAEAERRERAGRRERAAGRAAIGASGVRLSGTPTDVLADQAIESEINANLATFESELRSRELTRGAARSLTQANQLEARGDAARIGGFSGATGTLIGGASRTAPLINSGNS